MTNGVPRAAWQEVLAHLERGTVMVVGAPGSGRTAFAGYLVAQLDRALPRVAQIDAHPGQASIGLPACLGLALTGPWRAPAAQWFVGDTLPAGRPLPTVVGSARLAERAREAGARAVVIDAGADAGTAAGRELLRHLALAAGVDQVVALERNGEVRPLLDVLAERIPAIYRVPAAPGEPANGGASRALGRRLAAHLAGASPHRFPASRLLEPLAAGDAHAAGETNGSDGASRSSDRDAAPHARLPIGTLIGLLDAAGWCLGLGVLEESGPDSLVVLAACDKPSAVRRLAASPLRCEPTPPSSPDAPAGGWRLVDSTTSSSQSPLTEPADPPASAPTI